MRDRRTVREALQLGIDRDGTDQVLYHLPIVERGGDQGPRGVVKACYFPRPEICPTAEDAFLGRASFSAKHLDET
jgi:hypothetical protein